MVNKLGDGLKLHRCKHQIPFYKVPGKPWLHTAFRGISCHFGILLKRLCTLLPYSWYAKVPEIPVKRGTYPIRVRFKHPQVAFHFAEVSKTSHTPTTGDFFLKEI
jgi:hypothetical protein